MTEIYNNFIEWNPKTGAELFHDAMKRRAVSGLEVTEATQEEWVAAQRALNLKIERNIGD